ncbi:MAG: HAMP domain-containing histidine kinase [Burkholderiaceae bacterium]|nr:HAMP domain-containing histidine kinase [Burkholderiaceae bacterium]
MPAVIDGGQRGALRETAQAHLLAMVAHELRKPLSPIAIAASLLSESAGDAQKLCHLQSVIERQVQQLARVIADLTDTARTRTGKLSIERRSIVSTAFVEQAADACRAALDARRQRLRLQLPRQPFRLQADPGRLAQILTNLIDNASKFSAPGTSIVVTFAVRRNQALLCVADEGIGIAPEALATLFDPTVQRARTVRPQGAGLGLGLSIVRELAEAHGGSVRARSAGEGRGARFVVWLPNGAAVPAANDGAASGATRPSPAGTMQTTRGRRVGSALEAA